MINSSPQEGNWLSEGVSSVFGKAALKKEWIGPFEVVFLEWHYDEIVCRT